VIVRPCTVAELEEAPNLAEVLAEYAAESRLPELGDPIPQIATYYLLEQAGAMFPVAAFDGQALAGLILPIIIVLPHYGVLAATVESFFVPKVHRKQGVGMDLLRQAKDLARDLGAKALLMSAPINGVLDAALAARRSYRHSNNVYVVAL
jgi:GNAT superfamily N-acetyltransferase